MGFMDAMKGANMNFGTVDSPDFMACYLTTKGDRFMITGAQNGSYEFTKADIAEFKMVVAGDSFIKWKMRFKDGKIAIITSGVKDPTAQGSGVSMAPIERFFGDLLYLSSSNAGGTASMESVRPGINETKQEQPTEIAKAEEPVYASKEEEIAAITKKLEREEKAKTYKKRITVFLVFCIVIFLFELVFSVISSLTLQIYPIMACLVVAIPAVVFLILRKLRLFAIFAGSFIVSFILSSLFHNWKLGYMMTVPAMAYVPFCIFLIVNVTNFKRLKAQG